MPAAHPVPGDPADPDGFPALVEGFCEWMAVRGYSPKTVERYHVSLALFAAGPSSAASNSRER